MKKRQRLLELLLLLALSAFMLFAKVNYYIVMVVATLLIINFELGESGDLKELGITRKRIWPAIRIQLPFMLAGLAGLLIFSLAGGYGLRSPNAGYLFYWLVSIPLQEFLFRGYAQGMLRNKLPVVQMVLLVSVMFGLSHYFAETPHTLILMTTTFFAGLAWGYAYEKERNLIGPIFSHLVLGTLIYLILPPPIPIVP